MALRFHYKSIERPEPFGPKTLPVIPLVFIGENQERFESPALIDSGADFSVIFKEQAEILGINLAKCKETECQGVGGKVNAWKATIKIQLHGKGEHRVFDLDLPVMILDHQAINHPLLLGRAVFFEKFEIIFNEKQRQITLKPLNERNW